MCLLLSRLFGRNKFVKKGLNKIVMKLKVFIFLFILSITGNIIYFFRSNHDAMPVEVSLQNQYPLLSLLSIDPYYQDDLIINFLPLRQQIHSETAPFANSFAMYFEYLPTGTAIGINGMQEFMAESLLKLPVVMAYYHEKERLHILSDPTVTITQSELNNRFGDLFKKGAGYQINLGTAVTLALQKSDNTASLIIADHITSEDFNYVYEGLDIPETLDGRSPTTTTQEYASILKALYFQGMLNNNDSEKILNMLTKTDFSDLLPAGVPSNIRVAHKIGVLTNQIYSDCGIVYVPSRPYILCMVSESNYTVARSRMILISKTVYDYISHARIENID